MAEPNIVKGQIALDPVNDLLYYVNESNTIIATSLSWLKNDNNISTVENTVISGNLTVSGTTFTVNTETLLIKDNIIVLNSNYSENAETDVNAKNAGIEVQRGTQPNVLIRWNESTNKWQFSNDGTLYYNIVGEGNINLTLGADTIGDYVSSLVAGNGITLTDNSGEGTTPTIAVNTAIIATLASPTFTGTVSGITKTMVGLSFVDDTADIAKPVSTAQQAALDLKANLASPTFTGTVEGISPTMVGLGNVDNTSDANKPVSTATQTALDLKAPLASPTFTGTVEGISPTMVGLGNVDNISDVNKPVSTATQTALDLKAPLASPTFTGTVTIPTGASITAPTGLVKNDVGLNNVNNTSDADKPVSAATQTALDLKANIASPVFTDTVTIPTLIVDVIEIDTANAVTGQVLKFNGTKFAPGADDTAAPGALGSIDEHTDVTISTPITDGQVLILDNNVWINDNIVLNNIVDFNISNILQENEVLKFDGENWVNSTLDDTYDGYGAAATAATNAATALINHEADTTNIHGIVDTSILVTTTGTQTLTNKTITSPQGLAKGDVGLGNVNNTSDENKPVSTATQGALDLKAPLDSPTFTGAVTVPDNSFALGAKTTGNYVATITGGTGIASTAATSGEGTTHTLSIGQAVGTTDNVTFAGLTADVVTIGVTSSGKIDTTSGNLTIDSTGGTVTVDDDLIVTGNLTVNGNTTTLNTETITIEDKTIELGSSLSPSNTTANGAGIIVPDGAANKSFTWSSSSLAWSSSEDLNLVSGKVLKINGTEVLSATNYTGQAATVAANSVTQTALQEGVPRAGFRSQLNAQTVTGYTLQLTDLAKLITMDNSSIMTLTVPANSSVSFEIGDRIDILRKGSGELTITHADGVVVNGTPGLKLRAQWSSATLVKLDTDTWVALGDLKV